MYALQFAHMYMPEHLYNLRDFSLSVLALIFTVIPSECAHPCYYDVTLQEMHLYCSLSC